MPQYVIPKKHVKHSSEQADSLVRKDAKSRYKTKLSKLDYCLVMKPRRSV